MQLLSGVGGRLQKIELVIGLSDLPVERGYMPERTKDDLKVGFSLSLDDSRANANRDHIEILTCPGQVCPHCVHTWAPSELMCPGLRWYNQAYLVSGCFLPQRAAAAFCALAFRSAGVMRCARVLPPFLPPRRPRATAAGFL